MGHIDVKTAFAWSGPGIMKHHAGWTVLRAAHWQREVKTIHPATKSTIPEHQELNLQSFFYIPILKFRFGIFRSAPAIYKNAKSEFRCLAILSCAPAKCTISHFRHIWSGTPWAMPVATSFPTQSALNMGVSGPAPAKYPQTSMTFRMHGRCRRAPAKYKNAKCRISQVGHFQARPPPNIKKNEI